ncbi:MAG: hypothetical protein J1G38_03210 [Clostridiales bacterium]|nr:hypothetical protein [Clostridiales bacterium]
MTRADRNVIASIVAVKQRLYAWQDEIEKEQQKVIGDLTAPAKKTVEKLIELDNRRIDLCNLSVLNAFIERELGGAFAAFCECAKMKLSSPMYDVAARAIKRAGYDVGRVRNEFSYLFKRLKSKAEKIVVPSRAELSAALRG